MEKINLMQRYGARGSKYAKFIHQNPEICKLIAVAEKKTSVRANCQKKFSLPEKYCFDDYHKLIDAIVAETKKPDSDYTKDLEILKINAVLITTQDKQHLEPTLRISKELSHISILVEKPMAPSEQDCTQMVNSVIENKVPHFQICHVLRYDPIFQLLKKLLKEKAIGKIINIQHLEPIGWFHVAHSYCRGNWKDKDESTFMLLAKSCHDVDLIYHFVSDQLSSTSTTDKKEVKITSFGGISLFNKENKPKIVAESKCERCLECPNADSCPYSAKKIYLDGVSQNPANIHIWPVKNILEDRHVAELNDLEDKKEKNEISDVQFKTEIEDLVKNCLETSNYGKCVFGDCGNNVCDNQIVNFQFDDQISANLSTIGFTKDVCTRKIRIFGSEGEIEVDCSQNFIKLFNFSTLQSKIFDFKKLNTFLMNQNSKITAKNPLADVFQASESISESQETEEWMNYFLNLLKNPSTNEIKKLDKEWFFGHGLADYFCINNFVNSVRYNDNSFILATPKETLLVHLLCFAAERSRLNHGKVEKLLLS